MPAAMMRPEQIPTILPQTIVWNDMSNITASNMTSLGGSVSYVFNRMNNGINLQQGTSSRQPKNNTRTLNGLPVLDFDGVDDFMVFDQNTIFNVPFVLFIVAAFDTSTPQLSLIGRQTAAIAGQFSLRKEASGTTINTFAFGSGTLSSQTSQTGDLNPTIIRVSLLGTTSNFQIALQLKNGSTTTGTARSGYDNAVATPAGLGVTDTASPSGTLDGYIAEVIICTGSFSAAQVAGVNRYLSNKWGIAIS